MAMIISRFFDLSRAVGSERSSDAAMGEIIEPLSSAETAADLADLNALLRNAVEGGPSVGFMLLLADVDLVAPPA